MKKAILLLAILFIPTLLLAKTPDDLISVTDMYAVVPIAIKDKDDNLVYTNLNGLPMDDSLVTKDMNGNFIPVKNTTSKKWMSFNPVKWNTQSQQNQLDKNGNPIGTDYFSKEITGVQGDDSFKTEPLKRLDVLTDKDSVKVKLDDEGNYFIYAIFPKKPISIGGVLLTILDCRRTFKLDNGNFVPNPTGDYSEKEITYIYNDLAPDALDIDFKVEELADKDSNGLRLNQVKINKTITVPLRGLIKKDGTLALSYVDKYGNQENISKDYYINFTFVAPDRISVKVTNQ